MESVEADVELIKGSLGEFKVMVDDKLVFSRRRILGRLPDKEDILKFIT